MELVEESSKKFIVLVLAMVCRVEIRSPGDKVTSSQNVHTLLATFLLLWQNAMTKGNFRRSGFGLQCQREDP